MLIDNNSATNMFNFPDIGFIYYVYSNRISLMNINSQYAKEKTTEYYNFYLETFEHDPYKLYIYFTAQCVALGIPFIKIEKRVEILDIDDIVAELKYRITRWLDSL